MADTLSSPRIFFRAMNPIPDQPPTGSSGLLCLVCGEPTPSRHLGVGCRACAVFYRRARAKGKVYACKSNSDACEIDRDVQAACKKCRYVRFEQYLGRRNSLLGNDAILTTPTSNEEIFSTPMLNRVRSSYENACKVRIASELAARESFDADAVMEIAEGTFKLKKITYDAVMKTKDLGVKAHFQFVTGCFEEFDSFSAAEKWSIVRNCAEAITILEHAYLTVKNFNEDQRYAMAGLTMFYDYEDIDDIFNHINVRGDPAAVKTLFREHIQDAAIDIRVIMKSSNIDETELIAAFGLEMFSTIESLVNVSDKIVAILDRKRAQLLRDLHTYYTQVKKLNDYASRLGEIFCLTVRIKAHLPKVRENVEMWLLLDKNLDEHSLCYQFYRMELE